HRHVLKSAIVLVHPQLLGSPVVRDVEVYPPILIKVRTDDAQSAVEFAADLRPRSNIFERPVTPVAKQMVRQGIVRKRPAVVRNAVLAQTFLVVLETEVNIVGDE